MTVQSRNKTKKEVKKVAIFGIPVKDEEYGTKLATNGISPYLVLFFVNCLQIL